MVFARLAIVILMSSVQFSTAQGFANELATTNRLSSPAIEDLPQSLKGEKYSGPLSIKITEDSSRPNQIVIPLKYFHDLTGETKTSRSAKTISGNMDLSGASKEKFFAILISDSDVLLKKPKQLKEGDFIVLPSSQFSQGPQPDLYFSGESGIFNVVSNEPSDAITFEVPLSNRYVPSTSTFVIYPALMVGNGPIISESTGCTNHPCFGSATVQLQPRFIDYEISFRAKNNGQKRDPDDVYLELLVSDRNVEVFVNRKNSRGEWILVDGGDVKKDANLGNTYRISSETAAPGDYNYQIIPHYNGEMAVYEKLGYLENDAIEGRFQIAPISSTAEVKDSIADSPPQDPVQPANNFALKTVQKIEDLPTKCLWAIRSDSLTNTDQTSIDKRIIGPTSIRKYDFEKNKDYYIKVTIVEENERFPVGKTLTKKFTCNEVTQQFDQIWFSLSKGTATFR